FGLRARTRLLSSVALSAFALWLPHSNAEASSLPFFTQGDLVVSVEGNGSNTASGETGNSGANAHTYLDNQAAPLTLYEYNTTAPNQAPIVTLQLPQAANQGGVGNS